MLVLWLKGSRVDEFCCQALPQSSDTQPGPPYSCSKMVATRVFTEQNHCRALSFYLPLEFHIWFMLVELSSGLVYSMLLDVPHNCVRVIVEALNSIIFLTQSFLLLHSHLHRKLWEYFTFKNSFLLFLSCRWLKCLYSSRCKQERTDFTSLGIDIHWQLLPTLVQLLQPGLAL